MTTSLAKMANAANAARKAVEANRARGLLAPIKTPSAAVDPVSAALDESPTHEARRHGDFEVGGGERGAAKVWRNRASSPLHAAHSRGKVTKRQLAAGDAWEELHHRVNGTVGPRDSLDFSVRGNSQHVSVGLIASTEQWRKLVQAVGMIRERVISGVVVHWEPTGPCRMDARRFRDLVLGLDAAADFMGIAEGD